MDIRIVDRNAYAHTSILSLMYIVLEEAERAANDIREDAPTPVISVPSLAGFPTCQKGSGDPDATNVSVSRSIRKNAGDEASHHGENLTRSCTRSLRSVMKQADVLLHERDAQFLRSREYGPVVLAASGGGYILDAGTTRPENVVDERELEVEINRAITTDNI